MGNMKPENARRFVKWFFIVLFSMGMIIILGGMSLLIQSSASSDWPSVKGEIVSSETVTYEETSSHTVSQGRYKGQTRTVTQTMFKPVIRYKYTANGMQYESDRRSFFDGGSSTPEYAEGIIAQYPAGKEVPVYYDPDKPSESVLEPGTEAVAIIIISVVGLITCAISAGPFYGWRKLVREEKERQRKLEENAEKRRQIAEKREQSES